MTSGYVWRIVVDSWPTDNGDSFVAQGFDFWADVADALKNGGSVPSWLPADMDRWLPGSGYLGERHGYLIFDGEDGDWEVGDPGWRTDLLYVPHTSGRRYFSKSGLAGRVADLIAWGCKARIERAPIGDWETA